MRSDQSLSDFVGVVVLLCGACFAPLVMLRLVHFAADSHLAGEMVGGLRSGAQPAVSQVSEPGAGAVHRAHDGEGVCLAPSTGDRVAAETHAAGRQRCRRPRQRRLRLRPLAGAAGR